MPGFNIDKGSDLLQPSASSKELNRASRWKIDRLVAAEGKSIISRDSLLYAKSLTLPAYTAEEEQVLGGSISYKFAKTIAWEDVKVTFYDVDGILGEINVGRYKIWNDSIGLQHADNYKGESIFHLVDGDGRISREFILKNSWIKGVSHSDMSYDSSAIKEVTLTISYDWAVETSGDHELTDYKFKNKPEEGYFLSPTAWKDIGHHDRKAPIEGAKEKPKDSKDKKDPDKGANEKSTESKADRDKRWAKDKIDSAKAQVAIANASAEARAGKDPVTGKSNLPSPDGGIATNFSGDRGPGGLGTPGFGVRTR